MFSNGDYLTETIAHFIGHFDMAVEAARLRQAYDPFKAPSNEGDPAPAPAAAALPFTPPELIFGYDPSVGWRAPSDEGMMSAAKPFFRFEPPTLEFTPDTLGTAQSHTTLGFSGASDIGPLLGPPPPSMIAVVQQHQFLFDNDVIVIGTPDFDIPAPADTASELAVLKAQAAQAGGPLANNPIGFSEAAVAPWVQATLDTIATVENPTAAGENLSGVWVDGQVYEEAPDLDDHLPATWKDQEEPEPSSVPIQIDASETPTTMEADAGHNLAINQATIVNAGLTGTVIAVSGNSYELDVIVQTNVLADVDAIAADFPLAAANDLANVTTNIATFVTETRDAGGEKAELNPDLVPLNWQVSVVEGDMIFFEWIQQYTLQSDNDCLVMTATGTTTTVSTGANASFNGVSLSDLGAMYDLILIGGNLYDVNYITQTNILYDNDTISSHGATGGNTGSVATGGNLLWNQASIHNVGPANWTQGLPDHYLTAFEGFGNGDYSMPAGFAHDGMYAGDQMLNVLYISGNIYDVNYVSQTNILTDGDQVILYTDQAGKTGDWQITTGGNVLVNAAGIVDSDSNGSTCYVGGESYSEAMLIQSGIVDGQPLAPSSPDTLANEVIAFLDEDEGADDALDSQPIGNVSPGPTYDVMDHVLA
ncbi:hypothetical protein [Pelagibacterium sp. H642]|uniref:hypothetical protein n=1 Tax=Pelagibacterium sp. H642 TaxID=1881069 RepID=UPI002815E52D|nr:hypothetical protein [Pelagibacterium sp. H642]WMT89079.1 hypothetical protein NO934_09590 [Pelagibacterium sp. H642]